MLKRARNKVPKARLVQGNLLERSPDGLPSRFDRIVSAYVFHEFDDTTKLHLVHDLVWNRLANSGRLVVGDIAFATAKQRDAARRAWKPLWDYAEHYWTADEMVPKLKKQGLIVVFEQLSFCGGVLTITQSPERESRAIRRRHKSSPDTAT